jgi:hypothetical protein
MRYEFHSADAAAQRPACSLLGDLTYRRLAHECGTSMSRRTGLVDLQRAAMATGGDTEHLRSTSPVQRHRCLVAEEIYPHDARNSMIRGNQSYSEQLWTRERSSNGIPGVGDPPLARTLLSRACQVLDRWGIQTAAANSSERWTLYDPGVPWCGLAT